MFQRRVEVTGQIELRHSYREPADEYGQEQVLAPAVSEETGRYARVLMVYVARGLVAYSAVWLAIAAIAASIPGLQETLRMDISGSSALAAFAILATVVVGLQVAVRDSGRANTPDEVARTIARQRVLESVAAVCGMASIAVAFAAIVRYFPAASPVDIPHVIGPVAGGVLIAALAADASCVSDARWDKVLKRERNLVARRVIERALAALASESDPSSVRSAAIGAVIICVPVPLAVATLFVVATGWSGFWPGIVFGGAILAFPFVLIVAARAALLTREWLAATFLVSYLAFISGITTYGIWTIVRLLPSFNGDGHKYTSLQATGIAGLLVLVSLLLCFVSATFVPFTRKRGSGAELISWYLRKRLRRLDRDDQPRQRRSAPKSLAAAGYVVVAIAGPLMLPFIIAAAGKRRHIEGTAVASSSAGGKTAPRRWAITYRIAIVSTGVWLLALALAVAVEPLGVTT